MIEPMPTPAARAEAEADADGHVTVTLTWPGLVMAWQAQSFAVGPRLRAAIAGTRPPLPCRRCGVLFQPTRPQSAYCSVRCRQAQQQHNHRAKVRGAP